MKKLIMITVIAACLPLCTAMWPQTAPTEEVPVIPPPPAVSAPQLEIPEPPAIEKFITPEEEKAEIPQTEPIHEVIPEPEPVPEEVPMAPEVQPTPKPESASAPAPAQTVSEPQSGGMFYVPGFGWLESQGPGEVIYAEDMYENGNKIGIMG